MNHPGKVFLTLTAALLLLCPQIFAQEPSGEAAPPRPNRRIRTRIRTRLLQQFEKAPTLEGGTQKLYHIRNVNIHGAQYIDNSILRAFVGSYPGRFDIPAQQLHLDSHHPPVEPAPLFGHPRRCDHRRRQPRPGSFPEGTSPRQLLAFRGHLQKQPERPARKAQTQARHRAFRTT